MPMELKYDRTSIVSAVALLVYIALIFAIQPAFFSAANLASILYYAALVLPAVMGMHLLLILGTFDLSVGAVAAASAVIAAQLLSVGLPIPVAVTAGVLVGALFGCLNWLLVARLSIPALIGTLITMGAARATAIGLTQGQTLAGLPNKLNWVAYGPLARLSMALTNAVLFGTTLVLVIEFLSQRHVMFRRFYQAGSNPKAASDSGVNISALELLAFAMCGMGASTVGLLQSSRTLSASPHGFSDLAIDCIAACVVGGDSLSGGSGRPIGAVWGTLIVVISRNLVVLAQISVYWQDLAIAIFLLTSMLFNRMRTREWSALS
jgi:ribose/xylose/arabinose/galactoside ABC-type transport system permease subunit